MRFYGKTINISIVNLFIYSILITYISFYNRCKHLPELWLIIVNVSIVAYLLFYFIKYKSIHLVKDNCYLSLFKKIYIVNFVVILPSLVILLNFEQNNQYFRTTSLQEEIFFYLVLVWTLLLGRITIKKPNVRNCY